MMRSTCKIMSLEEWGWAGRKAKWDKREGTMVGGFLSEGWGRPILVDINLWSEWKRIKRKWRRSTVDTDWQGGGWRRSKRERKRNFRRSKMRRKNGKHGEGDLGLWRGGVESVGTVELAGWVARYKHGWGSSLLLRHFHRLKHCKPFGKYIYLILITRPSVFGDI